MTIDAPAPPDLSDEAIALACVFDSMPPAGKAELTGYAQFIVDRLVENTDRNNGDSFAQMLRKLKGL